MDFFEAQDRARRRTIPLVLLFGVAVLGTIVALYFAFVAATGVYGLRANAHGGGLERVPDYSGGGLSTVDWWQPGALYTVAWLVFPTIGLGALFKWLQLREGGTAVAAALGGRRVEPNTTEPRERQLANIVEEMAIASGLPVPALFVLPGEGSINAFAAGYSQADAAVAVTRGALERLDRDELQGVIAHEFSHILNGDMRLNTRLVSLLHGIFAIVIIGRTLLRTAAEFARSSGSSRKSGVGIAIPFALAGVALLVIGGIGHLCGRLFQAAVSRQREHLADAAAVQFTRNPGGLAGALKKLGALASGGRLVHPASGEIGHFCFAQNFRSFALGALLDTHPPLEARIRALDPAFDGNYPAVPDPAKAAGPGAPPVRKAATRGGLSPAHAGRLSPPLSSMGLRTAPALSAAETIIAGLPAEISAAVHDIALAPALACALCLRPGLPLAARDRALDALAGAAGRDLADQAGRLQARIAGVPAARHLDLLHLAAPALRRLDIVSLDRLIEGLNAIVHADGAVSTREFALQKIIARDLRLAARPREALDTVGPAEASPHLSIALSAAARLDDRDEATARDLFDQTVTLFPGLHPALVYIPARQATLGHLDAALDRLALTPAPFRKRVVSALATALSADGKIAHAEADLLRAFAAALDCPLPPVLAVSS